MSDSGSGEKTEEPTPERLRKLRNDGNVPKSQDITSAVSFIAVFFVLNFSFTYIANQMLTLVRESVTLANETYGGHKAFSAHGFLLEGLWTMSKCVAPALATAALIGLALNIAQVGFLFTVKPITPDFNKINPINGLKGLFNMKKVVELIKTILKFILISYIAWLSLRRSLRDVTLILRSDLFIAVKIVGTIIGDFVMKISIAFFIIAAADLFYQRQRYLKDNRMTKYDIKQEYKQSEGDPHHKSERRRLHQEILHSAGSSAVKGADVVVRNPNHIAIALKYEKDKPGAPKILAKGERIWAEKILEAAKEYNVPVVRNVPLAHALNKMDIGDEIPEELYQAVAEVLTFVYSLSQEQDKKRKK